MLRGFRANSFPITAELDSIYGVSADQEFDVVVSESEYFLRNFDVTNNFESSEPYFSNIAIDASNFTNELGRLTTTVSDEGSFEVVVAEDEETDFVEYQQDRLAPGLKIPLSNTNFFQTNIIDNEGEDLLANQVLFSNMVRGLKITLEDNDDILLLLDLRNARLVVRYEYDVIRDGEAAVETDDISFRLLEGSIIGNAINQIEVANRPDDIDTKANQDEEPSRLYVQGGGAGYYSELDIFGGNAEETLAQIRDENWLINEVRLELTPDLAALNLSSGLELPPRLYLFNGDTNTVLYTSDDADFEGTTPLNIVPTFSGLLREDNKYYFRITEYFNNIVDGTTENAPLVLCLNSSANNRIIRDYKASDNTDIGLPYLNVSSPYATVLFGSEVADVELDSRAKLKIFYTLAN